MSKNVQPDMLAFIERERRWNESRIGGKTPRVKIEEVNQAWLVRFLPVELGPNRIFACRQAHHWLDKTPVVCPRYTSRDLGGNEDAHCPVCEVSTRLIRESHEELSSFGLRLRANVTYATHCLVYQIDPGRGEVQELAMCEVLQPWQFVLPETTFDELCDHIVQGKSENRPLSVLDPKAGNNFLATKTSRGIRLDRQDPGPMFDLGPNFITYLVTVMNAVQQPKIVTPTYQEFSDFLDTLSARCHTQGHPTGSRRSRRAWK